MSTTHSYEVGLRWTGNRGSGTSSYRAYGRDHDVTAHDQAPIAGSSDFCAYEDQAWGELTENRDGSGQFSRVVLRPVVTVPDRSMRLRAEIVHADAHARCFLARSVNFPVKHEPSVHVAVKRRCRVLTPNRRCLRESNRYLVATT